MSYHLSSLCLYIYIYMFLSFFFFFLRDLQANPVSQETRATLDRRSASVPCVPIKHQLLIINRFVLDVMPQRLTQCPSRVLAPLHYIYSI